MSLQLKLEEIYGQQESGMGEDEGEIIEAQKGKDSPVEEDRSSEQGVKDEEIEDEEEEEEDDEDPKPRSFGKVAMASPQGGSVGNPPFPTIFASISLVSQVCPSWSLDSWKKFLVLASTYGPLANTYLVSLTKFYYLIYSVTWFLHFHPLFLAPFSYQSVISCLSGMIKVVKLML